MNDDVLRWETVTSTYEVRAKTAHCVVCLVDLEPTGGTATEPAEWMHPDSVRKDGSPCPARAEDGHAKMRSIDNNRTLIDEYTIRHSILPEMVR